MHLDHKLPWNALANHLILIRSHKRLTPNRSDLFWNSGVSKEADQATMEQAQNHFKRVFISTIRDFGATRLAKYGKDALPAGKLFSEELIAMAEERYNLQPHEINSAQHNPLCAEYADVDYWRQAANPNDDADVEPDYTTSNADLGDAVKMLIILAATSPLNEQEKRLTEEAMTALLRLSSNPAVPLHRLDHLSWGHGFGVSLGAYFTLQIYVLINLYEAVDEAGRNKSGMSLLGVQSLFDVLSSDALQNYDYPAQNIPHRAFWNELGVDDTWMYRQRERELMLREDGEEVVDPLANDGSEKAESARAKLREYLKTCFAMLYTYDILLRKWYGDRKADARWTEDIECGLAKIRHAK